MSSIFSLALLGLLALALIPILFDTKRKDKKSAASSRSRSSVLPTTWQNTVDRLDREWEGRPDKRVGIEPNTVGQHVGIQWDMSLLRSLDWRRFEEACELFWKAKGYRTRSTGTGADGGVDVVISNRDDRNDVFAVVQCKARTKPVGVEPVRALWGSKDHFGAKLALFYSLSGFTNDATSFAAGKHLRLISGHNFIDQIKKLSDEQQADLLRQVTRGDYTTPSCPQCESKMIRRQGRNGKPDFWGCPRYPRCKSKTIPMKASM